MQPTTQYCAEENRVTVCIWTSEYNFMYPGKDVGHISIKLPELGEDAYISLWPYGYPNDNILKATFEKRAADYKQDYDADLKEEKRPPEITICLYSLDVEKMLNAFKELQVRNKGWTLLGRNLLLMSLDHSCASLAYDILKKGKLYSLIPNAMSFTYSSVVSPDTLVPALIKAKQNELKIHPETKNYKDEKLQETDVTPSAKPSCTII